MWFPYGELLSTNQYGRSYIIQDKCSDTKLCATYYYRTVNSGNSDLEMRLSFWAAIDDPENYIRSGNIEQAQKNDSQDFITISANTGTDVQSVSIADGAIVVSPFSVNVVLSKLTSDTYVKELKLSFLDGSEYIVKDDTTRNCLFETGDSDLSETAFMLNRIVDPDNVAAVTVNSIRFGK